MKKQFYNTFISKIGVVTIMMILLIFPDRLKAAISVTFEVLDQSLSPVSVPLCGSPSQPSYSYILRVYSSSGSDDRSGVVHIVFKDANNSITEINYVSAVSPGDFSTGVWESIGSINMFNAPANRDNGYIYARYSAIGGGIHTSSTSAYPVTAPFVTISPSSASLHTVTGPTSVSLTASVTSSSTISWSPSAGLNTTTGATVIASPGTTKVYTATASSTIASGIIPGCTGTKTVTVTVTGPCCSSTRSFNNQTIVTDNVSNYISASGSSSIASGSSVTLSAANYIELNPDVVINAATSSTVFVTQITNCVYNACKMGVQEDIEAPVLLDPYLLKTNAETINIYPNPSSGLYTIACNDHIDEVTVTNGLGEIVYIGKEKQVNLSSQPEGIYFIGVSSKGKTIVKKVFKTK